MLINLTNRETKEFLIAKICSLQFGEEQPEEVIIDGSEWKNKLRKKESLRDERYLSTTTFRK